MPPRSQHAEFGYDITRLVKVDRDALTVDVQANNSVEPVTFRMLPADHAGFTAGQVPPVFLQLFEECLNSVVGERHSVWNSSRSLQRGLYEAGLFAGWLSDQGVNDINDRAFTLALVKATLNELGGTQFVIVRRLLVLAVKASDRSDRDRLSTNINKLPAPERTPSSTAYEEGQAEAVKQTATQLVRARIEKYQEILQGLGLDTSARKWWDFDAQMIINAALARDNTRPKPVKDLTWKQMQGRLRWGSVGEDEAADWAIINPHLLSTPTGRGQSRMRQVFAALYPDSTGLVAAAVLHCLSNNDGTNLSTLLNVGVSDITDTGDGIGIVATAKGRNRSQIRRVVDLNAPAWEAGTWHSNETGLLRMLIGWTVLSRRHRATHLGADHRLADRFYAVTYADPNSTRILTDGDITQAVAVDEWAELLAAECEANQINVPTLSFGKLRKFALREGQTHNPFHDVVDHSPRQAIDYLKQALPDSELSDFASGAFDEMASNAVNDLLDPEARQALADAVESDTALDLVINTCVSNGNDPDTPDRPCTLGITACFTCPNGHRMKDHLPGLVATVKFTEQLRKATDDPEVQLLHTYATGTLKQFREAQVAEATNHPEIENLVTIIGHIFTQTRRAQ